MNELKRWDNVPDCDGFYWYFELGASCPVPVLIDKSKYKSGFKSFDGSEQNWLRIGEYLVGPVEPPKYE